MAHTLRLSHSTFYSVRSNWEKEPPRPWGTLLQVQLQLHVHHFYAKTIFVVKYFKLIPIKDVSLVLGRVSGKLLDPLDAWEDWAWGRFRSPGLFSTFLNAQSCFLFFSLGFLSQISVLSLFFIGLEQDVAALSAVRPSLRIHTEMGTGKKKKVPSLTTQPPADFMLPCLQILGT